MNGEVQTNESLVQIAAMLIAAAVEDERLQPLANAAKALVLDSDEAVDAMFIMAAKPADQQRPYTVQGNPQKQALDLVQQILEKANK